jgi:hypothetical protein
MIARFKSNVFPVNFWTWRFSLRALMVAVTLLCILLGTFYVLILEQARRVRALTDHAAVVDFAEPTGILSGPKRLAARVFGKEGVYDVFRISFGDLLGVDQELEKKRAETPLDDADLKQLVGFPKLLQLNLTHTPVTKNGLGYLEPLKSLDTLILDLTSISDDAVPHLIRLRQLKHLSVEATKLTDDGLERLRKEMPWCKIQAVNIVEINLPSNSFPSMVTDMTLLADPPVSSQ